jgi:hypothetical protein
MVPAGTARAGIGTRGSPAEIGFPRLKQVRYRSRSAIEITFRPSLPPFAVFCGPLERSA